MSLNPVVVTLTVKHDGKKDFKSIVVYKQELYPCEVSRMAIASTVYACLPERFKSIYDTSVDVKFMEEDLDYSDFAEKAPNSAKFIEGGLEELKEYIKHSLVVKTVVSREGEKEIKEIYHTKVLEIPGIKIEVDDDNLGNINKLKVTSEIKGALANRSEVIAYLYRAIKGRSLDQMSFIEPDDKNLIMVSSLNPKICVTITTEDNQYIITESKITKADITFVREL
jgi:hypothetical protein